MSQQARISDALSQLYNSVNLKIVKEEELTDLKATYLDEWAEMKHKGYMLPLVCIICLDIEKGNLVSKRMWINEEVADIPAQFMPFVIQKYITNYTVEEVAQKQLLPLYTIITMATIHKQVTVKRNSILEPQAFKQDMNEKLDEIKADFRAGNADNLNLATVTIIDSSMGREVLLTQMNEVDGVYSYGRSLDNENQYCNNIIPPTMPILYNNQPEPQHN